MATVRTAMEALKPREVLAAQARKGLKVRHRNRRHNKAFIRQGEWFFIPEPDLVVDPKLVLGNEPLARGRGKPHWAEFLYRSGGVNVYVCFEYPQGLSESAYRRLIAEKPAKKRLPWRVMRRDAGVYVRGKIRHPDHKTVKLNGWHRVVPNTESQSGLHEAPCVSRLIRAGRRPSGRRPAYGVRGVAVSARLAVNQKVRVRLPPDTLRLKGGYMVAKILQRPTLVLNRNWQPVNVATVARALVLLVERVRPRRGPGRLPALHLG